MIASGWLDAGLWLAVLQVAIGLGMVIFVHELGHFAVAKACGVKCEKFYLGFDFGGLKIWKYQYGETEYGIGVFPLGGYVKMLGQEDNPARLREELERAKAAQQAADDGVEADGEEAAAAPATANPETPSINRPLTVFRNGSNWAYPKWKCSSGGCCTSHATRIVTTAIAKPTSEKKPASMMA